MKTLIRALCLLFLLFSACSLDNGAALLPPLIISTEKMGCQVNEVSARNQIDQMVNTGLVRLGYKYLLIQDCWQVLTVSSLGSKKSVDRDHH